MKKNSLNILYYIFFQIGMCCAWAKQPVPVWQLEHEATVQEILAQGQSDWQQLSNLKSTLDNKCTLKNIKNGTFFPELDLEGKIVQCFMISGANKEQIEQEYRPAIQGKTSVITAIVSYLKATNPDIEKINIRAKNTQIQYGKELFYKRSGQFDFSCATCHTKQGKSFHQMRLISVPNFLDAPQASRSIASWPAYRVEKSVIWTLQKRINECQKQMKTAFFAFDGKEMMALSNYMNSLKGLSKMAPKITQPENYRVHTEPDFIYIPSIKR